VRKYFFFLLDYHETNYAVTEQYQFWYKYWKGPQRKPTIVGGASIYEWSPEITRSHTFGFSFDGAEGSYLGNSVFDDPTRTRHMGHKVLCINCSNI